MAPSAAGLELVSPFFVGEPIVLQLACGRVDAIFCATEMVTRPVYLCEHPQCGFAWAHLGADLGKPNWTMPFIHFHHTIDIE